MKKFYFLLVLVSIGLIAEAQVKDPVKWTYTSRKKSNTVYELVVTATLPSPWHIYSMNTGSGGPVPTKVKFVNNPLISLEGNLKENGNLKQEYDKNFETHVKYFAKKVEYVQLITLKVPTKTKVSGTVEYMVCDDTQCLPPTKKTFSISL
jgi:hypothetical protein